MDIGALIVKSSLIGSVYPSVPLVISPESSLVLMGSSPKIPSLLESVYPASITSKHPSESESRLM